MNAARSANVIALDIAEAIARAKRRNQNETPAAYDFLKSVLLLDTGQATSAPISIGSVCSSH